MGQFSKNYRTFYQNNCQKALKNMVLGSGIRDPEKIYSGSRIQGSKRHRIPDPDPQHWLTTKTGFCQEVKTKWSLFLLQNTVPCWMSYMLLLTKDTLDTDTPLTIYKCYLILNKLKCYLFQTEVAFCVTVYIQ